MEYPRSETSWYTWTQLIHLEEDRTCHFSHLNSRRSSTSRKNSWTPLQRTWSIDLGQEQDQNHHHFEIYCIVVYVKANHQEIKSSFWRFIFFHLSSLIPVSYDTEIHEYHKSRGMILHWNILNILRDLTFEGHPLFENRYTSNEWFFSSSRSYDRDRYWLSLEYLLILSLLYSISIVLFRVVSSLTSYMSSHSFCNQLRDVPRNINVMILYHWSSQWIDIFQTTISEAVTTELCDNTSSTKLL